LQAELGPKIQVNSTQFRWIQVDSTKMKIKKSEAHENSRKSLISMIIPDNSGNDGKPLSSLMIPRFCLGYD
jgi:hypothetical protein